MPKNRDLGRWTGGTRSVADHLREYDWDGQIGPACAEIDALLQEHYHAIGAAFWDHYRTLDATQRLHSWFDNTEAFAAQLESSAHYARVKYGNPFGEEW